MLSKLLSITIILIGLFLIGFNWSGFWYNLTTSGTIYDCYARQATGSGQDCKALESSLKGGVIK